MCVWVGVRVLVLVLVSSMVWAIPTAPLPLAFEVPLKALDKKAL